MKIAFDAKKIVRNRTGIGNYSRRVLEALNPFDDITSMELFAPKPSDPSLTESLPAKSVLVTPPSIMPGIPGFELWRAMRSAVVANRHAIDIYHGLSNELPADITRFHGRKVVTIHDLIFMRLPETYSTSMRHILEKKTRTACRVADRIIAISNRTRDDLVDIYGIDPCRIEVIYQSINPLFFSNNHSKAKVPERRYILCVGTIQQRKNQMMLVEAMPMLPADVTLELIGRSTPYQQEIQSRAKAIGVADRLNIHNDIPTSDLPAWYRGAMLSCNPSNYEGFGLPVAESIALGTPVVAATGSCLEEAGGPGALYVTTEAPELWAEAISSIVDNPTLRDKLATDGRAYADNFRDATMGRRILNLYKRLLTE